ncbi:MAG: hypothetical protein J0I09_07910 [Sphingobacteriia bacterium]|nr:hypothetical protein [Sphingobacteriia bacterium]
MQLKYYLFCCSMLPALLGMAQQVKEADSKAFNDYFKNNEKNFRLIKTIDSLFERNLQLKKESNEKQALLSQNEYNNKTNLQNFNLYRLLVKSEKDSLKNLATDTSGWVMIAGGTVTLKLNSQVNFERLSGLVNEDLPKQFPLFFAAVNEGKIHVEQTFFVRDGCCGAGMDLPAWPVQPVANVAQNELISLFRQQNNYFDTLFAVSECARRFRQLFYQKMATFSFPQQVEMMIKMQITFKTFLQSTAGCSL